MKNSVLISLPDLHDGQRAVLESPARHKIVICGRRWGKTFMGVVLSLFGSPAGHQGAIHGKRIWWIAPTYRIATVAFDLAAKFARHIDRKVPLFTISQGAMRIRSASEGVLEFRSSDHKDNLRGEGLDGVVLDEADFQDETTWYDIVYPMLIDRHGWSLLVSTPHIEHGWLHQLYQKAQDLPNYATFHYPTWTSPLIAQEEVESMRVQLGELVFRREIGAEWVSAAGALVQRSWITERTPGARRQRAMGVDLAISTKSSADYTAIVIVDRTTDGWCVVHVERHRLPFHSSLQRIAEVYQAFTPDIVAIEAVAYQQAMVQELMRQTGVPVRPVRPSADKVTRFTPVAARYEAGALTHAPGLPPQFIEEICAFPVGQHDDYCDALAYALQAAGGAPVGWDAIL